VAAEQRLHALGQMAAGIAHDFNNCLSPIIGLSELILSRPNLVEDHDKVLKYVGTIHKAGLDAALVVSRLREYYRDAAGGEEVNVVDLKQVVQGQLKTMQGPPALHVLVIDDDEAARNLISEFLGLDGHKVDLADGPGAGLRKIRAGHYDLVITDRAMPEMSGDQVALRSKRVAPGVPVLMLTGLGDFMSAADERPEGVDVVVSKPITIDALRHAIGIATGSSLPTPWGGRPRPQGAAERGRHELPTAS
jgi:CheY-like chemotaxis protein